MNWRSSDNAAYGMVIFMAVTILFSAYGWVNNILFLLGSPEVAQWTVVEVIRVVGIFVVPVGIVMGYV